MPETRLHFHEQLEELERLVDAMGEAATGLLSRSLEVLFADDVTGADAVIAGDDEVDAIYLRIENLVIELFALQGPVASDLRFLAGLLHINLHLERVADMAVNIAKITKVAEGLPRNAAVARDLGEMGVIAVRMMNAAMDSFARRDVSLARELPAMDDPLDALNRGMLADILTGTHGKKMLEWGIHMQVVSRQIERVGDHAVDIGEQVAYIVTGTFQEFTDASHPEVEEGVRLPDAGV